MFLYQRDTEQETRIYLLEQDNNNIYNIIITMALTTREKDFSARYNELVEQAGLAQSSAVRGCMVIKPYGFAIWENMQKYLDAMFKAT